MDKKTKRHRSTLPSAGLFLATACVVVGCSNQETKTVSVDGSSTVYPVTEAVAEEFTKEHPATRVVAAFSGTGGGFKKFISGEISVCGASRGIQDSEKQQCEEQGIEYTELEVAFDGLAVVVNPENDWADSMTVEQLKEIWRPESAIQKWSDLNPDWPDEPIKLYGPGQDSGTFDYFTEVIVGESGASRGDYTASEDDNMLVTGVREDKYALGYFGYAYYDENASKLKLLGVDNGDGPVKPSVATVRDNSYAPLSRPLFIYVRNSALSRPEVRSFVRYYLDHCGTLAPEVGYVAISDEAAEKNEKEFAEAISG